MEKKKEISNIITEEVDDSTKLSLDESVGTVELIPKISSNQEPKATPVKMPVKVIDLPRLMDQTKLNPKILPHQESNQVAQEIPNVVSDSSKSSLEQHKLNLEILKYHRLTQVIEKISDNSDDSPKSLLDQQKPDEALRIQRFFQAMKEISNNKVIDLSKPSLDQSKLIPETLQDQQRCETMTPTGTNGDFSNGSVKSTGDKRLRTSFTKEQVKRLSEEFNRDKYPTEEKREKLAMDLGIDECNVKFWFKNRRRKEKLRKSPSPPQNNFKPTYLFKPSDEQLQNFYNQYLRKNDDRSDENSGSSIQSFEQFEPKLEPLEYQEPQRALNPYWLTARLMDKANKPHRIPYSREILAKFEKVYSTCRYPSKEERRKMSIEVGFDEKRVKVWFQNRRQKEKLHKSRNNNFSQDQPQDSSTPTNYRRLEKNSENSCFDPSFSEPQTAPLDYRLLEKKLKSPSFRRNRSSCFNESQLVSSPIDYHLLEKKSKSTSFGINTSSSSQEFQPAPIDFRKTEKKLKNGFFGINDLLSSKAPSTPSTEKPSQKKNFKLNSESDSNGGGAQDLPENSATSANYQQYYNWYCQQESKLLFMMRKQREETLQQYQQQFPEFAEQQNFPANFNWHLPFPNFENSEKSELTEASKLTDEKATEAASADQQSEDNSEYDSGPTELQLIPEVIIKTEDE